MKAVENLQSYQNETKAWRDKKRKAKTHRSRGSGTAAEPPHRSFEETEPKWTKPFMVVEKTSQDHFVWQIMKEGCWSILGTPTTSILSLSS
jgi:hypothetical protein